jgi:hypothetical protein
MINKKYSISYANGDVGEICELENGLFACIVCGFGMPVPYYPIVGVDGSLDFGDVCDCCNVETGVDIVSLPKAPRGNNSQILAKLRTDWLNNTGWSKESLRQLEENLGITADQARRDAEIFGPAKRLN